MILNFRLKLIAQALQRARQLFRDGSNGLAGHRGKVRVAVTNGGPNLVGLIVPAYLIPYGIATLAYGILADRIGIHRVMFASLAAFSALTILTATAQSIEQLALWRIVTGIGASGVVPLALTLVGRLYPYERRGTPRWPFTGLPRRRSALRAATGAAPGRVRSPGRD